MSLIEKIKLLFQVRKPATDLINEVKEVKSGFKTVAWWVTVLGTLLAVVGAVQAIIPASVALVIVTALNFVYQVLRMIQNAGATGVVPLFQSSRFWTGVGGLASAALISLKTGGIDPKWVETALAVIGTVMTASQNVGAQGPTTPAA